MELKREDAGEMYSPDDQGEYVLEAGMQNFSVKGLSVVLSSLESEVNGVQPPAEEYALLLWQINLGIHARLHSLGMPAWSFTS